MPTPPTRLKVGHLYFEVGYMIDKPLVPNIETYVYLGKNLYGDDGTGDDMHYFQEARIYFHEEIAAFHRETRKLENLPDEEDEPGDPDDNGMVCIRNSILEGSFHDLDGVIEFLSELRGEPLL